MDKDTYYIKLQDFLDKIKSLKDEIKDSDDEEKIIYLKLAVDSYYEKMRILMDKNNK